MQSSSHSTTGVHEGQILARRAVVGGLLAGAVAWAGGCTQTPKAAAGLELIIATDGLSAPADFDDIRLEVSQQSNVGAWNKLWDRDYVVPSQEANLPTTFAVVAGPSADQEVLIVVTAFKGGSSGQPVVQRVAQVQAPTDRVAALWLVLSEVCRGQVTTAGAEGEPMSTCPSGQSCQPSTGGCESSVISDPASLSTYMPGESLDAAPAGAVVPVNTQAEGGSDAGAPDATVAADSESDAAQGLGSDSDAAPTDATLPSDSAPAETTCAEAAQAHSYVGCDFWPTVVANQVWSIFDFAVGVANAGPSMATVTVTGPSNTNQTVTVPAGQLAWIYLPWVPALKGPDQDNCSAVASPIATSVIATASAFHLVSNVPVAVYQFNALEYEGQGGPAGKSWAACPGNSACSDPSNPNLGTAAGCYSFTNDASLLFPSTAMTGNYRVVSHDGWTLDDQAVQPAQTEAVNAYMAITGTQNGTAVKITVSSTGQIAAGNMGVATTDAGGLLTFTLNAGDVAELIGAAGSDLSGSIVQASAPVQVITGMPCAVIPPLASACDHMEESVPPVETLGRDYVVTRPTGPNGNDVAHQVRIFGNVDGTNLTYNPAAPAGCPATINAGQVVECGNSPCPSVVDINQTVGKSCGTTNADFEITGDQPFAVGTFTLGASVVDPDAMAPNQKGDPAQSFVTAVEQYRTQYVFVAPSDYPATYVDIVAPRGTAILLDGQSVTTTPEGIGTTPYGVYRVALGVGQAGAHLLTASQPVSVQIVGYGSFTSYMYPGGANLRPIALPILTH